MLQQQASSHDADFPAIPKAPLVYLDWRKRLDREIEQNFPAGVLASFTPRQLEVFELLRSRAPTRHAFEYRVSLPTPWRAYYVTIFAGPERRTVERLAAEGQVSVTRRLTFLAATAFVGSACCVLAAVGGLAVAKSAFGLDLVSGTPLGAWLVTL